MANNIKKLLGDKRGFTLVELMVVVSILGVLTMVAIPMFDGSLEKAKETACKANIRAIETAYTVAVVSGEDVSSIEKATESTARYLSDGVMPVCPVDENASYQVDINGKVIHNHGGSEG